MGQTKRITRDKPTKIKKIISTTKKLIIERGYSAVTTHHIAEEAGVSVGLVYKYFPGGKSEILRTLAQQGYDELFGGINFSNLRREEMPRFIRENIERFVRRHIRDTNLLAAIEIASLKEKGDFRAVSDHFMSEYNPFLEIFDILGENHRPSSRIDLQKWSNMIVQMIDSIVHHHILYGSLFDTEEELIEYLTLYVMKILNLEEKNGKE